MISEVCQSFLTPLKRAFQGVLSQGIKREGVVSKWGSFV